ncbi:ATP-grasp domain-containing protein [Nonomuraea sp. NPDC000554]|uniref:ATP-grasp domain-containing protein n=1 Tax=Nonomuraea sp. NPDC000554 TaxID=3154259 RepID=UPI00331FF8C9
MPEGFGGVWYRGPVVNVEQYTALDDALRARGCHLLSHSMGYRRAHELPGWLFSFWDLTPSTVVVRMAPGEAVPRGERLARLTGGLGDGGFLVGGSAKPREPDWQETGYAPDLAALERVAARFVELRGEDLAGRLVIRRFEEFIGPRLRVWWVDGEPVVAGPPPGSPAGDAGQPEGLAGVASLGDLGRVREAVQNLGERFVFTDLARRADGVLRVVEVGDGQVGGWPSAADPGVLIGALLDVTGYGFRVCKYDPALRDAHGAFRGDDWTSISDVGQTFDGVTLTRDRYDAVEAAHLRAVELLARESGVRRLTVRHPERGPAEGTEVPLEEALEIVRAMLREDLWCRLEDGRRFSVEAGYDYCLHVTSSEPCFAAVERIHRLGLFVCEESPFRP